ncbi:MAG: hypothetical protein IPG10_20765 [Flavobacteriales bacterium]|nr:hypothetical protein [Flavobacteriales bacterium]
MSIHVDLAMLYVLNERLPLAKDLSPRPRLGSPCSDLLSTHQERLPSSAAGQQEDSVRLLRSLVNSGVKEDDLRNGRC